MTRLEIAIRVVEAIVAALVVLLLGDYLGHKIGGRRLAMWIGLAALATVIVFAVYAAIVLG